MWSWLQKWSQETPGILEGSTSGDYPLGIPASQEKEEGTSLIDVLGAIVTSEWHSMAFPGDPLLHWPLDFVRLRYKGTELQRMRPVSGVGQIGGFSDPEQRKLSEAR